MGAQSLARPRLTFPSGRAPEGRPVAPLVSAGGDTHSRILMVAVPPVLLDEIGFFLNRPARFSVDHVRCGETAALLCAHVAFDMIIMAHPLPYADLGEFLRALRKPGSPCVVSHLLLVTQERELEAARAHVSGSHSVALSMNQPRAIIEEVAFRLLGVTPRKSVHLAVRLCAQLPQARDLVVCQTENVSMAGMLVRTDHPCPVGTRVTLEFGLPGGRAHVQAAAEIVRHTVPKESVRGVGLKFLEFRSDGRKQLDDFLGSAPRDLRG